jgi:hypothetical protein
MYVAAQAFKTPSGHYKKGDEVPFIDVWLEAGLIEQAEEIKPEPKAKLETKPAKRTTK